MITRDNLPVVVLPGMDGTGELLAHFLTCLGVHRGVHLISYSTQDAGYSELVSFVADRLPKERFVLVGESFSGPIAIEIAAKDSRVVGLVLASSFASHPLPSILAPLARFVDLAWVPKSAIFAVLLGSRGTPVLRHQLLRVIEGLRPEVIRIRSAEVLKVDKRKELLEINCPLLCLHGRFDRLVGKAHVEAISAARPQCQIQWFDAPHMLLETNSEEAALAISNFCSDLD